MIKYYKTRHGLLKLEGQKGERWVFNDPNYEHITFHDFREEYDEVYEETLLRLYDGKENAHRVYLVEEITEEEYKISIVKYLVEQ